MHCSWRINDTVALKKSLPGSYRFWLWTHLVAVGPTWQLLTAGKPIYMGCDDYLRDQKKPTNYLCLYTWKISYLSC